MHKKLLEKDSTSLNIAIITAPTLVFTFVIAEVLYKELLISSVIFGGLLIYGLLTSTVPMLLSKNMS
jgi:hypothetical protein